MRGTHHLIISLILKLDNLSIHLSLLDIVGGTSQ